MAELHLRGWLISDDGVAIQPVKKRNYEDIIAEEVAKFLKTVHGLITGLVECVQFIHIVD